MTETFRALVFGTSALGLALAWLAVGAASVDVTSPNRLVAELRLAQFAALLLTLAAGTYVGLAVAHADIASAGLDIALAIGFLVIGALATPGNRIEH